MQSRHALGTLSRALWITLGCGLLLGAGSASAVEPSYSEPGAYIAAGAGYGHWVTGGPGPETGAISLRAGWREPEVAFELQVDYLFEADTRVNGAKATLEAWAAMVNLRVPLTRGRLQPYLIAGFGVAGIEEAISGTKSGWDEHFAFRAGGGFEYWIVQHIAAGLGVEYFHVVEGFDKGFLTLTADVTYRF
jgi:opacity protein-like surface antigen